MATKLLMISLIICGLSLLSGCASLNSHFDCPMKPGVMCESLDQVNAQVDQGILGDNTNALICKSCQLIKTQPLNSKNKLLTPCFNCLINFNEPIRVSGTVLRIWIAPYQDKNENYYEPSLLYTVVKPAHWADFPVKAIASEGDAV